MRHDYYLMPIALALALILSCSSGGQPKQSMLFDEVPLSDNSSTITIKSDLSQWSAAAGSLVLMCECSALTLDRGFKYFYMDKKSPGTQAGKRPSFRLTFYKSPPDGMPVANPLSAAIYEGNRVNGKEHGHGTMVWPNGDRYEGDWRDGKRYGHGIMIWASGAHYEGDWRDGNEHGHGTMIYPNGVSYEGDWVSGGETGHGIFITANGERHEGDFIDGNGSTSKGAYITKYDLGILYWKHSRNEGKIVEQTDPNYMDAAIDAEKYVEACNLFQRMQ